ncbi:hypothetical protein GCK32_005746 [Trichostrongylus colubriformis]|uniref:Uncharacterized protein n=1 Tax=Trichostrongylus colubriformis TaxID=6319 RepID=A0AAN8ITX4_TRICO
MENNARKCKTRQVDCRPIVHMTRMSEQQIKDTYFAPLGQKSRSQPVWCPHAEARLLQLMCRYRPIGINKQINLDLISMYMKHIYAKEQGVSTFIRDTDLELYAEELKLPPCERKARFEPCYVIRPTLQQIIEKMNTWYDLNWLEYKEMANIPPELSAIGEFKLPSDYFTDIQDLDSNDEKAAQKMHCVYTSNLPKTPTSAPPISEHSKPASVSRRRNEKVSRRRSAKEGGRSGNLHCSEENRRSLSQGKCQRGCSSKNSSGKRSVIRNGTQTPSSANRSTPGRRRHHSEPKTVPASNRGTASTPRRHQSESRRRVRKIFSDSHRRSGNRGVSLEATEHLSPKIVATPRSSSTRSGCRSTAGKKQNPSAARKPKQNDATPRKRCRLPSSVSRDDSQMVSRGDGKLSHKGRTASDDSGSSPAKPVTTGKQGTPATVLEKCGNSGDTSEPVSQTRQPLSQKQPVTDALQKPPQSESPARSSTSLVPSENPAEEETQENAPSKLSACEGAPQSSSSKTQKAKLRQSRPSKKSKPAHRRRTSASSRKEKTKGKRTRDDVKNTR